MGSCERAKRRVMMATSTMEMAVIHLALSSVVGMESYSLALVKNVMMGISIMGMNVHSSVESLNVVMGSFNKGLKTVIWANVTLMSLISVVLIVLCPSAEMRSGMSA